MTRTVQWQSVALNLGKWLAMMALVLAYGGRRTGCYGNWPKPARKVMQKHPRVVVVLSGLRGRTKSRKLSRKVSRWMRSALKGADGVPGQRGRFPCGDGKHAYTSQECPRCGFVHRGNRKGDRFQCLHGHFTAHADTVGP